jgi:hypothetical protein
MAEASRDLAGRPTAAATILNALAQARLYGVKRVRSTLCGFHRNMAKAVLHRPVSRCIACAGDEVVKKTLGGLLPRPDDVFVIALAQIEVAGVDSAEKRLCHAHRNQMRVFENVARRPDRLHSVKSLILRQ